jgi:hypothetical protein
MHWAREAVAQLDWPPKGNITVQLQPYKNTHKALGHKFIRTDGKEFSVPITIYTRASASGNITLTTVLLIAS